MATLTRREVVKLGALALPAAGILSAFNPLRAADAAPAPAPAPAPRGGRGAAATPAKVDSRVNGVLIGINVPYSFGNNNLNAEETLANCVKLGVSGLELRAQPIEGYLGIPPELAGGGGGRGGGRGAAPAADGTAAPAPMSAEDRTAALNKWRLGVSMDKVREFRKKYEDAGMLIEMVKVDNIYGLSDDVLNYFFELTKTLGGRAISCEISTMADDLKRLGRFADMHQMPVGYHGHAGVTPEIWETAFTYAKYNWANVDLGHFVAGNNFSPVPFIKKHPDRITHMHIKDRKLNMGPNVAFGLGDTPIAEVLRLLRDNKWPIQATIEFEYPVPPTSDRMFEIAKCVGYCRGVLQT